MSTNDEKTTNKNLTFELPIKNLPIALEYYVKYPYELMQKAEEEAKKKAAELEAKIASMTPGERKEYDKEQAKIASMTPEERKKERKEISFGFLNWSQDVLMIKKITTGQSASFKLLEDVGSFKKITDLNWLGFWSDNIENSKSYACFELNKGTITIRYATELEAELEAKIASMTPAERKEYALKIASMTLEERKEYQAKIASMTPEERKEYHKEQAQQAAGQSNTEENNEGEFSKLVLRF